MRKTLTTSAIAVLLFTLVLGLAYPLAITGISQLAFPGNSNGSQIKRGATVVGSRLLAQDFRGLPQYFHPRPSATGWSASATFFANRGPNQKSSRDFHRQQLARYLKVEGPYNGGLTPARVPVDAVTDSASGVDPHISVANAGIQAARVAAVRHIPIARVRALIARYTDGRSLGLLGEPGVNVTELNLALDSGGAAR